MTVKKILVIDDEDDIRKLIQTCLEIMGGWQVITASCGNEGLNLAQINLPDAILLDLMMPEMDGLSTFENLQSNPKTSNIPIIMMTAKGRFVESKFTELSVKGVINKPFNPLKIANQVAAALS